jgi:REP element-mobilizing transposase RayT
MDSDRVFFVTTVTLQRFPIFRLEATAELLIHTLAHYRDERKFLLHEFVIMPDHIHVLLTPAEEISLERAMQFIKGGFSTDSINAAPSGSQVSRIIASEIGRTTNGIAITSG